MDGGELLYRTEARYGKLSLPEDVKLEPGTKYVWGILPAMGGAAPADWTEFAIADVAGVPSRPSGHDDASTRMLYAAWLRSRGLDRAAGRAAYRTN